MFIHTWNSKYTSLNFSKERLLWTHIVHMIWYNITDLIRACFLDWQSLYIGRIVFSLGKNYQWVTWFKRQLQNIFPFLFSGFNPLLNLSMEILLVKYFLPHDLCNKISAHLLLAILTHLLYNIRLIQSTAANMVCTVMLGYSTMVFFKLEDFLRFYFPSLGRKM